MDVLDFPDATHWESWLAAHHGARVEALIAAGRMRPSGFAEIAAAKADGRWDTAYESQRVATVPSDLAAALAGNAAAHAAFERLGRSDRYAVTAAFHGADSYT